MVVNLSNTVIGIAIVVINYFHGGFFYGRRSYNKHNYSCESSKTLINYSILFFNNNIAYNNISFEKCIRSSENVEQHRNANFCGIFIFSEIDERYILGKKYRRSIAREKRASYVFRRLLNMNRHWIKV